MAQNTCFFIGHSDTPPSVFPILLECIEQHITQRDVHQFFFGNHGQFDSLVQRALLQIKQHYPSICLIRVTPYHPASYAIQKPDGIDEIYYPFEHKVPPRYALVKSNQCMIRSCDYLIAYVWHTGKARDFLEYAQRHPIQITNIAKYK